MFLPCPHCSFLVAHHPQLRPLPRACPNCGGSLQPGADDGAGDVAPVAPRPQKVPAVAPTPLPTPTMQEPPAGGQAGPDPDPLADPLADPVADPLADPVAAAAVDPPPAPAGPVPDDGADATAAVPAGAAGADDAAPGTAAEVAADDAATAAEAPAGMSGPPPAGREPADAAAGRSGAGAPSFAAGRLARWRWALVGALAALLLVQSLLADRVRLAADPQWRPVVSALCTVLRCELPPWREPAALRMLDRKVRADAPGTLRVDVTFRNEARWAQAWPALQLTLADADGRTLASGIFAPEDYLGVAPDTLLAPGQSAQVTFRVREPAPGTVAFAFRFR